MTFANIINDGFNKLMSWLKEFLTQLLENLITNLWNLLKEIVEWIKSLSDQFFNWTLERLSEIFNLMSGETGVIDLSTGSSQFVEKVNQWNELVPIAEIFSMLTFIAGYFTLKITVTFSFKIINWVVKAILEMIP